MLFNLNKSSEEIRNFFSSFPRSEHESLLNVLLELSIKTLKKYPKLSISGLKKLVYSSEIIGRTEENVEKLQETIKKLQNNIFQFEMTLCKTKGVDKSTEMTPFCCDLRKVENKKMVKKVDFWNQTDEKENFNPSKSTRTTWNRNTEINWVHDFSGEVKKLPKNKSPLVIRESRISILSNQPKSKYSSIDEFF
jgi:hypothetical protein